MLKPIMMRRTKANLPELFKQNNVEEFTVKIKMSEAQRKEYDVIQNFLTKKYKELVAKGQLKMNMMHIFAIVAKLRQICDHK